MQNTYIIYYQNNRLQKLKSAKSVALYYGKKYAISLLDKFDEACVGKKPKEPSEVI